MKSQFLNEHLFQTSFNNHIQKEFSDIDQRSDKLRQALEELSATYDYASRSVGYAFQTSKNLQEMRLPEGQVLDCEVDNQPSFQEYTHKVEQILDQLANRMMVVVRQNKAEDFFGRGLYPIQTILNDLVKGRKEGN